MLRINQSLLNCDSARQERRALTLPVIQPTRNSNAIGMFFITADFLDDADISLSVGSFSVDLSVADLHTTLPDFSEVFFLGIVDTAATFGSAEISTATDDLFHYSIDDVVLATGNTGNTTAVPLPSPLPSPLLLIVPMLWGMSRRLT